MTALVSASDLAEACGLGRTKRGYIKISALARHGAIPFVRALLPARPGSGRKFGMMFDLETGVAAFHARGRERPCGACGRVLPLEQFRKRKAGTPAHDCTDCHKAYERERRVEAAAVKGRALWPSLEAWRQHVAEQAAARKARRLLRWREQMERARARRKAALTAPEIVCSVCGCSLSRHMFHASMLEGGQTKCRRCTSARDQIRFLREREELADGYVKRQLTKYSGLKSKDIPPALIEAKRAQLQLSRLVSPRRNAT